MQRINKNDQYSLCTSTKNHTDKEILVTQICIHLKETHTFKEKNNMQNKYMEIPITFVECHVWSDGEDDHEEDHNLYYDCKYFVVDPDFKPGRLLVFSWSCMSDVTSGFLFECSKNDRGSVFKHDGYMPVTEAIEHLQRSMLTNHPRDRQYHCHVDAFIKSHAPIDTNQLQSL